MSAQSLSRTSDDPYPSHAAVPAGPAVFCFSIQAEADPGVMSRVLALFAKRSLVPRRWIADRVGPRGGELSIDLQVEGLTPQVADYIARCLRQLHCVSLVLTSQKPPG